MVRLRATPAVCFIHCHISQITDLLNKAFPKTPKVFTTDDLTQGPWGQEGGCVGSARRQGAGGSVQNPELAGEEAKPGEVKWPVPANEDRED